VTARADLPTGTVTFMFSDIEASTRLLQNLGSAAADVFADHARLIRRALAAHGGIEIRTEGDAFFGVFTSAIDAVAAAAEAQRLLQSHAWPPDGVVRVRMGLHTGNGALGGDDYFGLDVHRAARIAATGHGGQVVISDATRSVTERSLPPGVALRDLGVHRLKDLAEPERLHDLVIDDLLESFPPLRTTGPATHRLPTPADTFVGRADQVEEVTRLLVDHPLVTLTGPGGVGKTRLSIAIANHFSERLDTVAFVPLAPVDMPGEIPGVILRELGLGTTSEDPQERLLNVLADMQCVLIIDNFEHLLAGATTVAAILRTAPRVHILVTSRAPLRIAGEHEYPVPPLHLADPGTLGRATETEAVRLFVERATAVRPDLVLDQPTIAAIVEITSAVDGIPLAIELAAARVRVMPPTALRHRMANMLDLLASSSRDLDERQRTLRGAIAWSYDLLETRQQRLFQELSVFRGGTTLDAIEAACGIDVSYWEWLEDLDALVGHSLVNRVERDGESRFVLLEVIREFAAEQLDAAGSAAAVAERHLSWFLGLAENAAVGLTSSDQRTWLATLDRERYNLAAALEWAMTAGDADSATRLVLALWRYWHMRGPVRDGAKVAEKVLAMGKMLPEHRIRALEAAGGLAWWSGNLAGAAVHYLEAVELARQTNEPELANALYNAGLAAGFVETVEAGEALLAEGLAIATRLDDELTAARCRWGLATVHQLRGDIELAHEELTTALDVFRSKGDTFMANWALRELGSTEIVLGRVEDARTHLAEALRPFAEAGDLSGMLLLLRDHARLAAIRGKPDRALRLLGVVVAHERTSGLQLGQFELNTLGLHDPFESLDDAAAEDLMAEGGSWSLEQAVDYALSDA
jgi:predicted ATPase/class 3 adenylate cyclase